MDDTQRMIIQKKVAKTLSEMFEKLLDEHGDTPETRLAIVNYTFGYMGAAYGVHIP